MEMMRKVHNGIKLENKFKKFKKNLNLKMKLMMRKLKMNWEEFLDLKEELFLNHFLIL